MIEPYIAIVADNATFDWETHSRRDLEASSAVLEQVEGMCARLTLVVANNQVLKDALGKRVFFSSKRRLLLDGVIDVIPSGVLDDVVSIEIIAKPPKQETLDGWLRALAEQNKVAPYYDPLFVPKGKEDDWTEILSGHRKVIHHSRIQGFPTLVSPFNSNETMLVRPVKPSLSTETRKALSKSYYLKLSASWKQANEQTFGFSSKFFGLTTFTPEGLIRDFPKEGTSIGEGFVCRSATKMEKSTRFGKDDIRRTIPVVGEIKDVFDPVWEEQGVYKVEFQEHNMKAGLEVLYTFEVDRTENITLQMNAEGNEKVYSKEVFEESIDLRDIVSSDSRRAWSSDVSYKKDDEVIDAGIVYRAVRDHRSGNNRTSAEWISVGSPSYLTSRSIDSFFSTARGRQAVEHAVERLKTRAAFNARCVDVKFEAKMPHPWLVHQNMNIRIEEDVLPGGFAEGKLVRYQLIWENGGKSFSGTFSCLAGTGEGNEPSAGTVSGRIESTSGRVDVSIENDGVAQRKFIEDLNGSKEDDLPNLANVSVPETVIKITATPAPINRFEANLTCPISNIMKFEKQIELE